MNVRELIIKLSAMPQIATVKMITHHSVDDGDGHWDHVEDSAEITMVERHGNSVFIDSDE